MPVNSFVKTESKSQLHFTTEVVNLLKQKEKLLFRKDEFLFTEKEAAKDIFLIERGFVKVFKTDRKNKQHIFYLAKKGEVLGVHSMFNNSYHHSAQALTAVTTHRATKEEVIRLMKGNSKFSMEIMQILCKEIDFVEDKIKHRFNKNCRQRLAETLLSLQNINGNYNKIIPFSYAELANLAGTSAIYLKKLIGEFIGNNWIDVKGHQIQIVNSKELMRQAS